MPVSADQRPYPTITVVKVFADDLARYRAGKPLRNVVDKTLGYVTGGTS